MTRPDTQTARTVAHGITLSRIRGRYEAAAYMLAHGVVSRVIVHVLADSGQCRK